MVRKLGQVLLTSKTNISGENRYQIQKMIETNSVYSLPVKGYERTKTAFETFGSGK